MSVHARETYARIVGALAAPAASFDAATRDPRAAQLRRLREQRDLLGLGRIDDLRQLRDEAPLSTYDDIERDVARIADGEIAGIRGTRTRWLEESGGTSGRRRMLPITEAYLAELGAGLAPWLRSLFTSYAGIAAGPAYWSISPMGRGPRTTRGGVPLGALSDVAYFPPPLDSLLADVLAVSGAVGLVDDVETCRYLTALLLLERDDLAFISVWSPTFLTMLLDFLERHAGSLIHDVRRGTCTPPNGAELPPGVLATLERAPKRERADVLSRHLGAGDTVDYRALWPHLAVISMWTDASAAAFVADVRRRFPDVTVEPKGLLATEGIVTLPIAGAPAPVLAINSHVYEFLPEGGGAPLCADELALGETYEVVMTTGAGLVRFRLGDRVRVEGHYRATPCFTFVGRAGALSDLVGEKLSASAVDAAFASAGLPASFALLAPILNASVARPHYRLYVDSDLDDAELDRMAASVDRCLCSAHAYGYARALEQLGAIDVCRVTSGIERYERRCLELGQRAGDIKPVSLRTERDWDSAFLPFSSARGRT